MFVALCKLHLLILPNIHQSVLPAEYLLYMRFFDCYECRYANSSSHSHWMSVEKDPVAWFLADFTAEVCR